MKRVLFILFTLFTITCSGQGIEALDAKFGFRDVLLEKPLSSFKGLILVKKGSNGLKYYKRPSDKLTIGEYKIENIYYEFFNDFLYSIIIQTQGNINSNGVLNILRGQYGQGDKHLDYRNSFMWLGNKVNMIFLYDEESEVAKVTIGSNKIDALYFDYKKKREAAASDL